MALIDSLTFTQTPNDINTGVVTDASNYGVGGNPARNAKANYLLFSKTDKNGNRSYDNPVITDPLSQLTYNVNTPLDGWYEAILLRFSFWSNVTAYFTGNVVYYSGSVYISKTDQTNHLPTDTNFWTLVTDLTTLVANTSVSVYIGSFYIKVRINECVAKKFEKGCGCGCGCDEDLDKIKVPLLLHCKILSANAAFDAQNYEQMEKIIRDATETCVNC